MGTENTAALTQFTKIKDESDANRSCTSNLAGTIGVLGNGVKEKSRKKEPRRLATVNKTKTKRQRIIWLEHWWCLLRKFSHVSRQTHTDASRHTGWVADGRAKPLEIGRKRTSSKKTDTREFNNLPVECIVQSSRRYEARGKAVPNEANSHAKQKERKVQAKKSSEQVACWLRFILMTQPFNYLCFRNLMVIYHVLIGH